MSLARHLRTLGDRYLAPRDDLRITILNVDRAGTPRPNLPTGFRVMRGDSDFPLSTDPRNVSAMALT